MPETIDALSFGEQLAESATEVEAVLDRLLPALGGPELRLYEAMRYATLNGGKRLRAFLVCAGSEVCGAAREGALRAAASVEMIHAYSLIHDDLPAMDDDDLRRGKPSCHIQFGEATAILAGDALQALAFQVLSEPSTHGDAEIRCELSRALAIAAGAPGMVGGQMIDLAAEHSTADAELILRLQRMKTGALIAFSAEAGAVLADAPAEARDRMRSFGYDLGLAFQIKDDLLDVEGEEANVGKKVGKDAAAGKATFIGVYGVEGARGEARRVMDRAIDHLNPFGAAADPLRQLCEFVLSRKS